MPCGRTVGSGLLIADTKLRLCSNLGPQAGEGHELPRLSRCHRLRTRQIGPLWQDTIDNKVSPWPSNHPSPCSWHSCQTAGIAHVGVHVTVGDTGGGQAVGGQAGRARVQDEEQDGQLVGGLHGQVLPHGQVDEGLVPPVRPIQQEAGLWVLRRKRCTATSCSVSVSPMYCLQPSRPAAPRILPASDT